MAQMDVKKDSQTTDYKNIGENHNLMIEDEENIKEELNDGQKKVNQI